MSLRRHRDEVASIVVRPEMKSVAAFVWSAAGEDVGFAGVVLGGRRVEVATLPSESESP